MVHELSKKRERIVPVTNEASFNDSKLISLYDIIILYAYLT